MEQSIIELNQQLNEMKDKLSKISSELDSAQNQIASDREVKYYLDENFTRLTEELL